MLNNGFVLKDLLMAQFVCFVIALWAADPNCRHMSVLCPGTFCVLSVLELLEGAGSGLCQFWEMTEAHCKGKCARKETHRDW